MNSDGEKIPPRRARAERRRGGEQLGREQQRQEPECIHLVRQNRLDRGVADAFDVVMAEESEQQIDQHPDPQHADAVAQIGVSDMLEDIFRQMQAANESGRRQTAQTAENGIEHEAHRRAGMGPQHRRRGNAERRLHA
jgi:hypothetical protein